MRTRSSERRRPTSDCDDAKDVVYDDVRVAGRVVQREVQHLRPEAVMVVHGAEREPQGCPSQVGTHLLRVVHKKRSEAEAIRILVATGVPLSTSQ